MSLLLANLRERDHFDRDGRWREEHQRQGHDRGTMIRHALGPAGAVVAVAIPMIGSAFVALLVALASGADALASRLPSATQATVDVAVVTPAAQEELLPASSAHEDAKRVHATSPGRATSRWT